MKAIEYVVAGILAAVVGLGPYTVSQIYVHHHGPTHGPSWINQGGNP